MVRGMNAIKPMILAAALAVAATGCDNPADGKAKAKVEEAAPTAAPAGTGTNTKTAEAGGFEVAGDYRLVAKDSKLGWVGSKVTGSHDGGFKTFEAAASLKDGTIEGGSVTVRIETKSIFSDSKKLTGHLMSDEFFDVKTYPDATFVSTEVKEGGEGDFTHTLVGNLTLHGETKKITFPATIAKKDDTLTVASEFVINRKDFGMKYPGKPDDLIRDEVVIKLDLALVKG